MTTQDAADRVGAKLRELHRDMPEDEGAILEALLIQAARGIDDAEVQSFMIMGFMHMAAGTQDAMKRVLFGAAGATGGPAQEEPAKWILASPEP